MSDTRHDDQQPDFRYTIGLSDPKASKRLKDEQDGKSKSGLSTHTLERWNPKASRYEPLSETEERRHRTEHDRHLDELSFRVDKDSLTELVYTIAKASAWRFAKTPFGFDPKSPPALVQVSVDPKSMKTATMRVKGANLTAAKGDGFDYTLRYTEEGGDTVHEHDPRIRNGQAHP